MVVPILGTALVARTVAEGNVNHQSATRVRRSQSLRHLGVELLVAEKLRRLVGHNCGREI